MFNVWGYYLYRFGLPLLVGLITLCILNYYRWTKHKGWWFAGLFFAISLVCLLPMKGNPFDQVKLAHDKSQQVLKQAHNLTTSSFMGLSEPHLANKVTDKEIQKTATQLHFVESDQRQEAQKAIQTAWDCWHVKQAQTFFTENLGFNPDEPLLYPDKSKIKVNKLSEAEQLLDKLKDSDKKYQLKSYLKDCQSIKQ